MDEGKGYNDTNSPEPGSRSESTSRGDLQQRRILFAAVALVGLAAVAYGVFGFFHGLKSPFAPANVNQTPTNQVATSQTIDDLRGKDTDKDGLSDYDELYVHRTSPYLDDSDSDGIKDGAEISGGTDANCPQGQNCFRSEPVNGNANTSGVGASGEVDINTLREALRNAGAPESVISTLTDEELLTYYNDTIVEQGGTPISNAVLNTNVSVSNTNVSTSNTNEQSLDSPTASDLQNLTPDQIRSLLIESGVDEATLSGVDDETLKSIYQQALQEQLGQ